MKNIILSLVLLTGVFFASCSSDNPVTPGGGTTTSSISGNITNAPSGTYILRAVVSGNSNTYTYTDTVVSGNNFSISLTVPPANILLPVKNIVNGNPSYTISDSSAFYTAFSQLNVYNLTDSLIGRVMRKNYGDSLIAGSFIVLYLYSDRNTSITGTSTTILGQDTSVTAADLHFSAGWNVVSSLVEVQRANYTRVKVASGEPAGATWRFETVLFPRNERKIFEKGSF